MTQASLFQSFSSLYDPRIERAKSNADTGKIAIPIESIHAELEKAIM